MEGPDDPRRFQHLPDQLKAGVSILLEIHSTVMIAEQLPECQTEGRIVVKVLYSDKHTLHRPRQEFEGLPPALGRHPEMPSRAEMILAALESRGHGPVLGPRTPRRPELEAVHAPELLDFLSEFCARDFGGREEVAADAFALHGWRFAARPRNLEWRFGLYCFDPQTPLQPGTWPAALAAAGCALGGARLLMDGEAAAYALCRPPGHHAGRAYFGGYCYLNNAAAAVPAAIGARVAILDLDFHHGNGTQDIFYECGEVMYVSLHADPHESYPYFSGYREETGEGRGSGTNLNFPLPKSCEYSRYRQALAEALEAIVRFGPVYLVVSLGTDILAEDPVGGMGMSVDGFGGLGEAVRELSLPTLVVQEGGYAVELVGECVAAFLEPWERPRP
jgi:acetoin utilization deacetylase AcuC-like enzyme